MARFLNGDDRVKVTIMFRGREQTHPERGERLLLRLADDVAEIGTIEQRPQQDGRNMTMLAPADQEAGPGAEPEDGADLRLTRQRVSRRSRGSRLTSGRDPARLPGVVAAAAMAGPLGARGR